MTAGLALDAGLAVLVLAVAVWTIAARAAFAAVVGFVAYGLLLALVWVRLAAVDVALTEAAIGSGVTGAVLIAAAARLRPTEARSAAERPGAALRIAAGVLSRAGFGGARGARSATRRTRRPAWRRRRRRTCRRSASAIRSPLC